MKSLETSRSINTALVYAALGAGAGKFTKEDIDKLVNQEMS